MHQTSPKNTRLPWWLTGGSEQCDFCLESYHYEAVYYCIDCDSPICPVCVVFEHREQAVLCPECHRQRTQEE